MSRNYLLNPRVLPLRVFAHPPHHWPRESLYLSIYSSTCGHLEHVCN